MKTIAIIGAGYGDEGKGLATDYIVSELLKEYTKEQLIVVRFNGGAQAGHTVVTPKGIRHVFRHFGSGTLLDVPTFLSKFFICNPILFNKEHAGLSKKGFEPIVYVDPNCEVTTPYDMLLNQIRESNRGKGRHGSCGVGINETLRRSKAGFILTVGMLKLLSLTDLHLYLERMLDEYYLPALKDIPHTASQEMLMYNNSLLQNFVIDCSEFCSGIIIGDPLPSADYAIFEGAQGLMLDQNHGNFPYVTPSNTGIKNVLQLVDELDCVLYVTRCYQTRHGVGPFPDECDSELCDQTNIENEFQGKLRYAPFDDLLFETTIAQDVGIVKNNPPEVRCMVTCLDQMQVVKVISYNGIDSIPVKTFAKKMGFHLQSYGPTRATVKGKLLL